VLPRIATFLLFLSLLSVFLPEIALPGVSSAHSNNHAGLLQTETHNVREIPIVTTDVVFERNSGRLYASVPSHGK
jgi:hypothetical protein